jgi:hypothetical protein
MQDTEQKIRERAYQLWLESGFQDGHADAHWLAAQREILDASMGKLGHVTRRSKTTQPKSAPSPRKKKRAA